MRNPRRAYDAEGREIRPMDVANAREAGATGIWATCESCGHEVAIPIERFGPHALVPDLSLRMRCSQCGSRKVATMPDWRQTQPAPAIPTPMAYGRR